VLCLAFLANGAASAAGFAHAAAGAMSPVMEGCHDADRALSAPGTDRNEAAADEDGAPALPGCCSADACACGCVPQAAVRPPVAAPLAGCAPGCGPAAVGAEAWPSPRLPHRLRPPIG
jgi:hypothetical protein